MDTPTFSIPSPFSIPIMSNPESPMEEAPSSYRRTTEPSTVVASEPSTILGHSSPKHVVTSSTASSSSSSEFASTVKDSLPVRSISLKALPLSTEQTTLSVNIQSVSSPFTAGASSHSSLQLLIDAAAMSDGDCHSPSVSKGDCHSLSESKGDCHSPSVSKGDRHSSSLSKNKMKASMLKFPPCDICEGKASGLHYGCNTCEACKNFYRRYLLRKRSYHCTKNNDCIISCKNKGNCSACRLERCLKLGMSKDKSKMGRYSYSRRTETINKVRKLEGKDHDVGDEMARLGLEMDTADSPSTRDAFNLGFTREMLQSNNSSPFLENSETLSDKTLTEVLVSAFKDIKPWGEDCTTLEAVREKMREHHEKYQLKVQMFGPLGAISKDEYQTLLKKYGIDIDGQFELFKRCSSDWDDIIGKYCTFVKKIPEFRKLSYTDQSNLLKSTHSDFFTILMHQGYADELRVFLDINAVAYHFEEAADKFFTRGFLSEVMKVYVCLQKLELTDSEAALLMCIVTVSTDVCKLQNPECVENIQLSLTNLLIKDLRCRVGVKEGSRRFAKFIDCLTKLRDVAAIYYKEYKALCQDDMITQAIPNIDCCLPDDD